MTQILTGHGCFGQYLCRIGRECTTACHHCRNERDTAQHTLANCPAWDTLRRALTDVIGEDLSLPTVIRKVVGSEEAWSAFSSFCEAVMLQKEEAERIRRREAEDVAIGDRKEETDGEEDRPSLPDSQASDLRNTQEGPSPSILRR